MVEPVSGPEQLSGHPAADRVTPEALVVEQSRSVVGLSTWLADAAVVARASRRLLQVLDGRLDGREWIMDGDYTIADIALLGWVRNLVGFYEAAHLVDYHELSNVHAWLERGLARPAVQRGLKIPSKD